MITSEPPASSLPPAPVRLTGRELRVALALFATWLAVVVVGTVRHEYWRDEIRAYSFARDSHSLGALFDRLKDEGHPMLWHLLLYAGDALAGSSRVVLPIVSLGVAAAAVALVLFRSPLPTWLKALFVLGGLPLYEYSVMARNYGISMLLMFGFAAAYPGRARWPRAVALGLILAALANTNVHSVVLAILLLALWLWDDLGTPGKPVTARALLGVSVAVVALGLATLGSFATMWPSDQILPSDPSLYTAARMVRAMARAVRHPARQFGAIVPPLPLALLGDAVFVWATLGLLARPALLVVAWAAALSLSVLFEVVYPGSLRHEGLYLVFLVTLTWIRLDHERSRPGRRSPSRWGSVRAFGGLAVLLTTTFLAGDRRLVQDLAYPESASRAFGEFLRDHRQYAGAILVGEPDFYLESLPYYADNPIYVPRERRFGDTVHFTRASRSGLGLGELVRAALDLQAREGRTVLIALGHLSELDATRGGDLTAPQRRPPVGGGAGEVVLSPSPGQHELHYSYGRTFSWSATDLALWRASTIEVARFDDHIVGDERYAVYTVTAPPPSQPSPAPPRATR